MSIGSIFLLGFWMVIVCTKISTIQKRLDALETRLKEKEKEE
jgi:hypothetical protein